jgi:tRNA threonylcarbamoyladenosine biosynthesis protein TsaE
MEIQTIITHSEDETVRLGYKFAGRLKPGDIVSLYGTLGSGKTEFIKGIAEFFDVEEIVTSPTFTIINQYFGKIHDAEIPIYHIDLYRIKSEKELTEIGFTECINSSNTIKLIEWAEKAPNLKIDSNFLIEISLSETDENQRIFTLNKL